ncbi:hypothetical protein ABFS83_01G093600 [Erythranthe nasuta]
MFTQIFIPFLLSLRVQLINFAPFTKNNLFEVVKGIAHDFVDEAHSSEITVPYHKSSRVTHSFSCGMRFRIRFEQKILLNEVTCKMTWFKLEVSTGNRFEVGYFYHMVRRGHMVAGGYF